MAMRLTVALSATAGASAAADSSRLAAASAALERVVPLHRPIAKPGPSDWLAHHQEPGQTFRQYVRSDPVVLRGSPRRVLYIQPLGELSPEQRRIVALTAEFMGLFYSAPVKVSKELPLSLVPAEARRHHPEWGMPQILTTYVLDGILRPRLPDDAAACIALTASDLWPGKGWNFVFGQASLRERVGVWSLYRNGDPAEGPEAYRLCLLRTLKTAVHETGHMISMYHCTLYECGMCGSNHREESDRRPLWFCPECDAKVWWATGADAVARYRKLAEFCRRSGLATEAEFYARSAAILTPESPRATPATP